MVWKASGRGICICGWMGDMLGVGRVCGWACVRDIHASIRIYKIKYYKISKHTSVLSLSLRLTQVTYAPSLEA